MQCLQLSCVNQNIQFNDLSTGNPINGSGILVMGLPAHIQSPLHPYTSPGVYDVTLTVYNQGCFQQLKKTAYITINSPKADFTYSFTCGNKTNYTFTDNSIGATGWDLGFWRWHRHFNAPSPTHVYATMVPASYNVTLTVTNSATGCTDISHPTSGCEPIYNDQSDTRSRLCKNYRNDIHDRAKQYCRIQF